VVELAAAAGTATLPVVGGDGRPLGCIPAAALLEIAAAEHREDVHRMAGILREAGRSRHALEDPPLQRLARRLPWLLVGLALSSAGTVVMAGFAQTLQANIAIAFFIPALVYLTDAIGTQTEAIAVRGLAVARRPFAELLLREVATGGLIGGVLGALAFAGISLVFADLRLAACVGLSLLTAGALASAIGLSLPWALLRAGADPALGSGPVATIVQDVLTLLVYFGMLALLM
jgi:magnesium transporter